jgi:diguanylate cyclase (GGDEF)-like protein
MTSMIALARLRMLGPVALPAGVLAVVALALAVGGTLPESLAGLAVYGPYTVLLLGAVISFWFNRGRAFVVSFSLLAAFIGYHLTAGSGAGFAAKAVFTAAAIFVPLNILLTLLLPERGIAYFRNYRWLLLLLIEFLLAAWIAGAGKSPLSGTAWIPMLDHWLVRAAPTPFLGRVLMAVAFTFAVVKAWPRHAPLEIGVAGALVAFFFACQWPSSPGVYPAFTAAAGAIMLLAVLQESHRMAFLDELTGLPGRRALEERLVALGPSYVIAMVDVDHFKKFNDTHGHDIGDQVLKMVGSRLNKVEGGGKSFRYGGEEFSVLFPDKTLAETLPYLEALRKNIENYKLAVRTEERRKDSREGKDRRTTAGRPARPASGNGVQAFRRPDQQLSVTVSIGVAERSDMLNMPAKVIKAADQALYRAKEGGRNRVSG